MCSEAQWKWINVKITLDAAARFVAQPNQHTHATHPEGDDSLKARAGIKRSARDSRKNAKHYHN